jgi:hypothetical protein
MMQEYWVNVYAGVPAYCCSKQPTREASIKAANNTPYDWSPYRIHVKMKPVKAELPYPKLERTIMEGYRTGY